MTALYQRRRLPPAAFEYELVERPAALANVALAQLFRRSPIITRISQADRRDSLVRLGDFVKLPRLLRVEARHTVCGEAQGGSLQHKEASGDSGIVERVPVSLMVMFKLKLRDRDDQHRDMLGPCDVAGHETGQHPRKLFRLFFARHQKAPGLLIEAGGRPARRLQNAEELFRLDGPRRKDDGTPAMTDHIQHGMFCLRRLTWRNRFRHVQLDARATAADARRVCSTDRITSAAPEPECVAMNT